MIVVWKKIREGTSYASIVKRKNAMDALLDKFRIMCIIMMFDFMTMN